MNFDPVPSAGLNSALSEQLVERVLTKLGVAARPDPALEVLRLIYAAWCRRVPFDNVRKLIHLRAGNFGPLPGSTGEDFFEAWLKHGTGGTCWPGAGALQTLLASLGFAATRGIGTMLAAPNLPPNHGSVLLLIEDVGLSEEIVWQLPEDTPTPPPPWSRTAQSAGIRPA